MVEVVGDWEGAEAIDERLGRCVCCDEIVLARPDDYPLEAVDWVKADPLGVFAQAFAMCRAEHGETARIRFSLLPLGARQWHRWQKMFRGPAPQRRQRDTREVVEAEHRADVKEATSKAASSEPMFACQILVTITADDQARAYEIRDALRSCFDQFKSRTGNYFKPREINLGLTQLGTDELPWRGWMFDRRESGLFMFTGKTWALSGSEVEWLLKPPTKEVDESLVMRSGGFVPEAPRSLPIYYGAPDTLPIGRVGGEIRAVFLKDTKFFRWTGKSGSGKTNEVELMGLHVAERTDSGEFVLDIHGETTHGSAKREDGLPGMLEFLWDQRERVVVLDVSRLAKKVMGWNPLDMSSVMEAEDVNERVKVIAAALAHVNGWTKQERRAWNLLQESMLALAAVGVKLRERPDCQPTIFQVTTLLNNDGWRAALLPHFDPPQQDFFGKAFRSLPADAGPPVTHLLYTLRASLKCRALLGQSHSAYNARRAMDEGQIVLACTAAASGREADNISAMLVFDLLRAAKSRLDLFKSSERLRPFFCFLDEAQVYDDGKLLVEMLEQVRKFGLVAGVFNQDPNQLTKETQRALSTNASHRFTGVVSDDAAAWCAGKGTAWGRAGIEPATLTRLPLHHFVGSVTHKGQETWPFAVEGVPVTELFTPRPDKVDELEEYLDGSCRRKTVDEVNQEFYSLDQRILDALEPHAQSRPRRRRVPA